MKWNHLQKVTKETKKAEGKEDTNFILLRADAMEDRRILEDLAPNEDFTHVMLSHTRTILSRWTNVASWGAGTYSLRIANDYATGESAPATLSIW